MDHVMSADQELPSQGTRARSRSLTGGLEDGREGEGGLFELRDATDPKTF